MDFRYDSSQLFQAFEEVDADFSSTGDSIVYSTFNYKGRNVVNNCEDWDTYAVDQLFLPLETLGFTYMEASFGTEDLASTALTFDSANCSDVNAIDAIITSLNEAGDIEIECNGRSWRVYTCSAGAPVLCIDCTNDCSESACPGNRLTAVDVCQDDCPLQQTSSFAAILFGFEEVVLYPLFQSPLLLNSTSSEISISYNVSRVGIIYCAAVSSFSSLAVTSTTTIRQNGLSQVIIDPSEIGTLTIRGLQPDTNHNVYCFTSDLSDNNMPFDVAGLYTSSIATECCREINFITANDTELVPGQLSSFEFVFQLNAVPVEATTVSVVVSQYDCSRASGSSTLPTVSPSSITFATRQADVQGRFRVTGGSGCYRFDVAETSAGLVSYDSATLFSVILDAAITPRPPRLSAGTFSADGRRITVDIDSNSDRGETVIATFDTSFSCHLLLDFDGASGSTCIWVAADEIQVTLGSTSTIEPEDVLKVLPNIIRAECTTADGDCSAYEYATQASFLQTTVQAPSNALAPTVSLVTARSIGVCDDMTLDPTGTFGAGTRDFSSIVWTVSAPSVDPTAESEFQSFLNTNFARVSSVVTVPSSFLAVATVVIRLQVTNFLGASSAIERTIEIVENLDRPIATVTGSKTWLRSQTIRLVAEASLSSCLVNATTLFQYDWAVYRGATFLESVSSTSPQPSIFKLSPYSLDSATFYTVVMTVTAGDASTVVTKALELGEAGVLAKLSGGSSRVVSVLDDISLDASTSLNIDYPEEELNFSWECSEISPSFGASCSLYDSVFSDGFAGSTVLLPGLTDFSNFDQNTVYNVTLTISDENGLYRLYIR